MSNGYGYGVPDDPANDQIYEWNITLPDIEDYETRKIVVAHGLDFHDNDAMRMYERIKANKGMSASDQKLAFPLLEYLERILNDEKVQKKFENRFEITDASGSQYGFESVASVGKFKNKFQKVEYLIIIVHSKKDFKKALETEGMHVIYWGHSRYGRGACFDLSDSGTLNPGPPVTEEKRKGNHWENGTDETNGLFRYGYPFVAVSLHDINACRYNFNPVSTDEEEPPNEKKPPFSRHPSIRNQKLSKITLPEIEGENDTLEKYVIKKKEKDTKKANTYYGIKIKNEQHIILHADWKDTSNTPFDLGATDLKCKVLCLFSCDTKLHFWDIIRRSEYKGWERNNPQTDKFAYFTTFSADLRTERFWLECLLKYSPNKPENFQSWKESLENAKTEANKKLINSGADWKIN